MKTTQSELAQELVRVTSLHAVCQACRNDAIGDLINTMANVLEARLGKWDSATERAAIAHISRRVEDMVDDDTTEAELIDYLDD